MPKVLIVYYTRSGNTQKMAQAVADGVRGVPGVEVEDRKSLQTGRTGRATFL